MRICHMTNTGVGYRGVAGRGGSFPLLIEHFTVPWTPGRGAAIMPLCGAPETDFSGTPRALYLCKYIISHFIETTEWYV